MVFCNECGQEASGKFCANCGNELGGGGGGGAAPAGHTPSHAAQARPSASANDVHHGPKAPGEQVLWEGTTWPAACLSPMCCSVTKWRVTNRRIDMTSGCCGSSMDTIDLRRVRDIAFRRSCFQLMCNRGSIIIYSADETDPEIKITTFRMKPLFVALKEKWSEARIGVAVGGFDDGGDD